MNLEKRAFLYLTRKKGKNLLLAIVFLLISFSLLAGSSVYLGIQQISKDLRSNIGASFSIRPYEQFDMDNGQVSSKGTPTIDEQSIQRVISAVGKELKCYNTEHSGYVKGEKLTFLAGAGHNEESNMGTVKAVRDSSLCQNFLDEEYELSVGEHIKPEDKDKILISEALAKQNHLSVGDKITLTHAKLGSDKGVYTDLIKEKSAYETVEIKGIYQIKNNSDNALNPTAKKVENLLFSDSQLLINLKEQTQGMVSTPLSSFGSMVDTAVLTITVIGMLIIVLFLVLWTRSRNKEIAILLAVGRSKVEIIAQFLVENILIGILSIFASTALSFGLANQIGSFIISKAGENISNLNIQIATSDMIKVFGIGFILICLAVIIASYTIIRLRPKDILTKME